MSFHQALLEQATMLVHLNARRPTQANLRRGVSTAYYAVFHLLIDEATRSMRPAFIRAPLRRSYEHGTMKFVCRSWSSGQGALSLVTRNLIVGSVDSGIQSVASAFVDLQEARQLADYDLARPLAREDAIDYVEQAREAFADWHGVRQAPNAAVFLATLLFEQQWRRRA